MKTMAERVKAKARSYNRDAPQTGPDPSPAQVAAVGEPKQTSAQILKTRKKLPIWRTEGK